MRFSIIAASAFLSALASAADTTTAAPTATNPWATYPSVARTATINGFVDRIYDALPQCGKDCVKSHGSTANTPCPYWDPGCLCVMPQYGGPIAQCFIDNCKALEIQVATSAATSVCSVMGVWEPYWYIPESLSTALIKAAAVSDTPASTTAESSAPAETTSETATSTGDSSTPVATASPTETTDDATAPQSSGPDTVTAGESAAESAAPGSTDAAGSVAPSGSAAHSDAELSGSAAHSDAEHSGSAAHSDAEHSGSAAHSGAETSGAVPSGSTGVSASAGASAIPTVSQGNNANGNAPILIGSVGSVFAALALFI